MSVPQMKASPAPDWARALLEPRAVALVGISDDLTKTAARPLQFLRRAGYARRVYPVNPTRTLVQGERSYPSLAALPERPDHAFILAGTEAALAAVEQCGELGIPVATILAGGFAESGPEGEANELRLKALTQRYGVRVLGPSSIGIVNLHERLVLTANAAFAEPDLPVGGVFVGSHSGSLIGALVSRGKARGVGFSGLVSVGAESDLSMGEICAATLDDPRTTGYLLFLETMRHADALQAFALEAARRGKPVAAYKLGRSPEAAELAVSHTGSLAGADDVADTFLRECGIARVESFEGLLDILPLLQKLRTRPERRPPAVGVVTTTGGGGGDGGRPARHARCRRGPAIRGHPRAPCRGGRERRPWPHRRPDPCRHALRRHEGDARRDAERPRIRPGARHRGLVGPVPAGPRGQAGGGRRVRACQAACGLHRARCAGSAGAAGGSGNSQFPHAGDVR